MPPKKKRADLDRQAYRRAARRLRAQSNTCHICNTEIDTENYGGSCDDRCKAAGRHVCYLAPEAWTVDHVLAWAEGGRNDKSNLRPAHRGCNAAKGARPLVGGALPRGGATHNHEPGEGPERWGGRKGLNLSRNWWTAPDSWFDENGSPVPGVNPNV